MLCRLRATLDPPQGSLRASQPYKLILHLSDKYPCGEIEVDLVEYENVDVGSYVSPIRISAGVDGNGDSLMSIFEVLDLLRDAVKCVFLGKPLPYDKFLGTSFAGELMQNRLGAWLVTDHPIFASTR